MSTTIELYAENSSDQVLKAPPVPLAGQEHAADSTDTLSKPERLACLGTSCRGFTSAARELRVTPAAVSHQIKTLESHLNVQLFRRLARGLEITEAGRQLLPQLTRGFDHFTRAVDGLSAGGLARPLTVTTAPSLVGDHLATGRLVRPLKASRPANYAYYAVMTHAGAERPRVQAFLGWLESQVERDARETESDF